METASRRINTVLTHLLVGAELSAASSSPALSASAVAGSVKPAPSRSLRTAVVVSGVRTPFVKSFTDVAEMDSIDLGVAAVRGLLEKTKLDPKRS